MNQLSKTAISGYIYEIIGYEDGVAKFKINLTSTRGQALIIAELNQIYTGAYVDLIGYWEEYIGNRHFNAIKVQIIFPKNIERIASKKPSKENLQKDTKKCEEMLEQAIMEELLIFCKNYNVPARYASLIYKTYKEDTLKKLINNPYKLAFDLQIISFDHAEKISMELGKYKHLSPQRIEAGIKYVLSEEAMKGDISASSVVKKVAHLLSIREELAAKSLEKAVRDKVVVLS